MKNKDDIILSSVTLHRLNEEIIPIGSGTGCIIDMPDCDYLFTVCHVANKTEGKLAILSEYIEGTGPKYVVLGQISFEFLMNVITREKEDIEFAFAKIPIKLDYFYQEIKPPSTINVSKKIRKYKLEQIKQPSTKNIYGFAGHTQHNIVDNYAIQSVFMTHFDYKYKKTEGWTHIFEPPVNHPGHEYYQGCSGAPIIDEENNIVSLVVWGDIEKNEIYGIDLEKAMIGFYHEIGK